MSLADNLGPALRKLRRRAGLTQRQLVERACALGARTLTTSRLSRWERSLAAPSLRELAALLAALELTLWDLSGLLGDAEDDDLLERLRSGARPAPIAAASAADLRALERRIEALEARLDGLLDDEG